MNMTTREPISFFRQIVLVSTFLTLTPLTIVVSLFSLLILTKEVVTTTPPLEIAPVVQTGVQIYASLPENVSQVEATVREMDARALIVRNYLARYDSPIVDKAEFIVKTADKHGLDFRLTTAIAQQESNLCKRIPPETYNCWGWGIHSRGTLGFESFEEGIETVSQGLKANYIDLGYVTPEQIMTKYTPQSNGSWARGVSLFMEEML